jgi:cation diffusion facilitator CzcD-associated flavoprotein CzcO
MTLMRPDTVDKGDNPMLVVDPSNVEAVAATDMFAQWVERFGAALEAHDSAAAASHFRPDGYWRDILSFTWAYRTFTGPSVIEKTMLSTMQRVGPRDLRVAGDRVGPKVIRRSGRTVLEGYFDFTTDLGRGTGFARLQLEDDGSDPKIWLLLTTLQELVGFEETIGDRRPGGEEWSYEFGGENWLDRRRRSLAFDDRDPEVIIVGAGQSGLALAARFAVLGVDALLIEQNPRVGDNWRNRYHSLTLHNEVWANELPYVPFPPNWPTFVPKDKLAGFLEAYAEFMELNVWTSTGFEAGEWDDVTRRWTVRLRCENGTTKVLSTPHLVLATGSVSGPPRVPALPGLGDFAGEVMHSSSFRSGHPYRGKRAVVVGTGNSGHDVAQDLHSNGAARVTMIQRSPTCTVSLVPSGTMVYSLYNEGPAEDIDLITAAIPYPVLKETYQFITRKTCELDKDLLKGLESAGFELEFGEDGTGFHMNYLRRGGGYYINVGCSDLIARHEIDLVHYREVATFTPTGVRMTDDSEIPCDLVVLATGYENQREYIRRVLGDAVADRVGEVWDFNEDGFMRNMWAPTGQEGFWLMGGSLMECRLWSRFLALQIKADLEGLDVPTRV